MCLEHVQVWSIWTSKVCGAALWLFSLGFLCCSLCSTLETPPWAGYWGWVSDIGLLIAPVLSPSEGLALPENCLVWCWHVPVEQGLQSWIPHHKSAAWAIQPSWCPYCCGWTLLILLSDCVTYLVICWSIQFKQYEFCWLDLDLLQMTKTWKEFLIPQNGASKRCGPWRTVLKESISLLPYM